MISLLLVALLLAPQHAQSMAPPYPDEIMLKAGLMPSFAFAGFQADLVDRVVKIAEEDNVSLKFEMTAIEEFYSPNIALISPECGQGETTEVNGTTYNCDDFDLIVGDFWTTPDRYTRVDYIPALLTSSITAMKYIEKTKFPNLDVTTLSEATRARVPVCAVEFSSSRLILTQRFPDINLVPCPQEECLDMLRREECFLFATDEMELRSIQTTYPEFEVTGERLSRQLIAWPVSKSLDPTASFLLNKWIYAAISGGVIDELYFEYFEKKLCPIGTAGRDCELPCHPDHGASNAQGQCICESIRWTGSDCSVEVLTELNMIPSAIKGIAYSMFGLNAILVLLGGIWLRFHWKRPEVQYSQPFFLALVLVGCLVSTATILAMAQEDEGDGPVDSCVAIPWLYSLGFSITFGTLFAKIRRVYGIFSREHQMSPISSTRRAVLSFRDTFATIGKVLVLDVVILTLWTAIEPLHWERTVIRQDQFGFPLESQGYCISDRWEMFLGAIIVLHIALCAIACYMCYMARNIPSRYSEHKYLTIAMVSNLQVFAIGVPVLIIAGDDPTTDFFVRSAIVWMNDFVVLCLIFGNLVYAVHNAKSEVPRTERDKQKVLVSEALKTIAQRQSTLSTSHRRGGQSLQLQHSNHNMKQDLSLDSDLESSGELKPEATNPNDSDSQNGSAIHPGLASSQPTGQKESLKKQQAASEITLSGFDSSSNHDDSTIEVPSSNSIRSGDSAARWERPRIQEPPLHSQGPAMPTRGEAIADSTETAQGEHDTMIVGDTENWDALNTKKIHDSALEIPDRLTSIAEWSDDEEVSANAEPPALRKSIASEHAPVMPRRFVSEFESA